MNDSPYFRIENLLNNLEQKLFKRFDFAGL